MYKSTLGMGTRYRDTVCKILVLMALSIILIVFFLPLIIIAINSFKLETELFLRGPFSIPRTFTLDMIIQMWERVAFGSKMVNSTIISVTVAFFAIVISVLNGYSLGIGRIKGATFFLVFFILAMTMPQEALAYPLYYIFKMFNLYDTKLSIIIIFSVLHSSYGTYLLTSVFHTFPKAIIESAMIDGCKKWSILFKIVFPLNMPTVIVLFVFFFIWTWNEFFLPLIFLVSNKNQTVSLAVTLLQTQHIQVVTMQSASALLGIVPCIIFFIAFQRTFTRGITTGGVKG